MKNADPIRGLLALLSAGALAACDPATQPSNPVPEALRPAQTDPLPSLPWNGVVSGTIVPADRALLDVAPELPVSAEWLRLVQPQYQAAVRQLEAATRAKTP